MNENLKILFNKLEKDEAAIAKLQAVKDPDEAYALVSAIQDGYTKEEFLNALKQMQDSMNSELSDSEVAAAAGGMSTTQEVLIITTTKIITYAAQSSAL